MPAAAAIVGIGCRLPGDADTPAAFWRLLCDGVDAISEIPPDRFDVDAVYDPDPAVPGKIYSRWGGFVRDVDRFDADFFGIAPREAKRLDPQHRLLLEVAWEALEDGGLVPERLAGTPTGVFVGISTHDYADQQMAPGHRPLLDAHVNIGNALCAAPNRISYLLDLRGPSMAIETACSSSMTALHLACRSMATGESSAAIVAGVNLVLGPDLTIGFSKASMISPDGRCRAFDAGANGYVRSEGAGAIVLKPLDTALADGDRVYAVVRGTAINEDGRTTGISLPNADAQEVLIRQTLRDAGVAPTEVDYVEAHGTGTVVGDPAEADAFGRVLGRGRPADRPLLIGSAKTNVGHLEAGSGITGLIKAALMVRHRQVPPSLHFEAPNPAIAFDDLRLRVPTALEPWPTADGPATVGVNSSGFGGSNAHAVLQAPPPRPSRTSAPPGRTQLLLISARTPPALVAAAQRFRDRLVDCEDDAVPGICATAANRRTHFEHRLGLTGACADELIEGIDAFLDGQARPQAVTGRSVKGRPPKLALVFAGMGPQWWGMGRQLLAEEPRFRERLEACDDAVRPLAGWSLLDELAADEHTSRIGDTRIVQVVNCAFQIALADLWRSWGIIPDAVIGHSAGEMAAAHVAGALSLRDALHVSFHRGRLLHRASGTGRMLAAAISADEAAPLVDATAGRVSLAAVNSATSVTLSGESDTLGDIAQTLEERERFCRFLPTDVPYHGPQMDVVHEELLQALHDLQPRPATIPMVSEVSGTWLGSELLDGAYWWRNIRQSVLFEPCVGALIDDGYDLFCEVSPHPALTVYVQEGLAERGRSGTVLPSLRRHEDERRTMLQALAAMHVRGRDIDWSVVSPDAGHVDLPTYPWQRERFWFDRPTGPASRRTGDDSGHPLLGWRSPSPTPTWESSLADPRLAYLDQHVVEGTAVFPGAGYVSMAVAAGRRVQQATQVDDDLPVTLDRVAFRKLLFLDAQRQQTLQLQHHPRDGLVEIHGAPDEEPTSWTLHATATLRTTPGQPSLRRLDLAEIAARCPDVVPAEQHHRALERHGFHYGPAFRGLQEVRVGRSEALAHVRWTAEPTDSGATYEIHPALLDSAFQLLVGATAFSQGAHAAGPVFPVAIRRVVVTRSPGTDFWVHASLQHLDDGRIEGDVTLTDGDGGVVMVCEGVRSDAIDRGATGRDTADTDHHLYDLAWVPRPRTGVARQRAAVVDDALDPEALAAIGDPERDPGVRRFHEFVSEGLDRVARGYARQALARLAQDGVATIEDPAGDPGSHRRRLHRRLVQAVEADDSPTPNSHGALRRALDDLVARAPAFAAEAELVRRSGEALEGVLRGQVDPREVLLTGDALEVLSRMYHDSPASAAYHTLLADAVAHTLARPDPTQPVRVLEVGAGTGAATESILRGLPAGTEYLFTDISPHFLSGARTRFGTHPGMRFRVLDIESEPDDQGVEPGSFDMVIAANVVHTTVDVRATLRSLRRLLAPHGVLAMLELAAPGFMADVVFGLLDGWWRFEDIDLRPDHPLLDGEGWRAAAEGAGFDRVTSLPMPSEGPPPIQTVILAQAPAAPTAVDAGASTDAEGTMVLPSAADAVGQRWLILTDGSGVGTAIAEALRARGGSCTIVPQTPTRRGSPDDAGGVPADDPQALHELLSTLQAAGEPPDAIVHLWSLDGAAAETAEDVMDVQRLGSGSVLALAQAIEQVGDGRPRALWLVTAGAQAIEGRDAAPGIAQAPLWGLGRVVMSEQLLDRCCLVDIGPQPGAEEIQALVDELVAGVAEEEVALRSGNRFVRRLRRTPAAAEVPNEDVQLRSPRTDAFRIALDGTATLDGVHLRQTIVREPGPGEVRIRVRASGLNFRDVLQALGMLPDAALATDPDPDAVGIECAGVVECCGPGVEEFSPGDEVIALAWGAHGSLVVTSTHLVVPKPPTMTFAQAASVSNAFVTADHALGHVARLAPGERVLIHSAAGAVGLAAIQYCQRVGAEVYATSGTPEKRAHLRSLGIDHVMDSRTLDFVEQVRSATDGEGVDVVLNSLSGEAMRAGLELLRPYGRFVELGKRDIYDDAQVGLLPFGRNLSYTAVDLIQLALDRPEVAKQLLLTAVGRVGDGTFTPVPCTTFDLAEAEEAFRFMAQARHIGKVVLTVEEAHYPVHPDRHPPLCRADGTYLITGGLGGLGLASAAWLVQQGARHVVLMSRSGVPKDDAETLEALMAADARVEVVQGDVSRAADLTGVLARIRAEMPPLRGVLHAAMVLDDDALGQLDAARLRAVLAPKVAGAWNLHRLTAADPLDLFVMFSSVASIVGNPMQANYAAANAFLDALADHRRARDLPALTIAWGALSDVGYVARNPDVERYVTRGGFGAFTPDQACELMDRLLRRDVGHAVAARIDWAAFMQANPALATSPRFELIATGARAHADGVADGDRSAGVVDRLRQMPPADRVRGVEDHLVELVARVLGASPERVDADRPLTESGFDSLMASELVTAVESELRVRPPVVKVLQGGSTRDLAAVVHRMLAEGPLRDAAQSPPSTTVETGASPPASDDEPAPVAAAHPLSFEQQRFWFLHRLQPHDPAYNVPLAVRLRGTLDVAALHRSLDTATTRHEILRMTVEEIDGQPVQTLGTAQPVPLDGIDLGSVSQDVREDALQRQAMALIRRPFDLGCDGPLRVCLFRMDEREHVLVLVVHHIACDAWSLNWLAREVARLYDAHVDGVEPDLAPPAFAYPEYVQRQRERADADTMAVQLAHWTRQLDGSSGDLGLHHGAGGMGGTPRRGAHLRVEIPEDLTAALQRRGAEEGVTLFATLLAAFQAVLSRWSGQEDICIGSAVTTRDGRQADDVVGCFLNTVALRGDLSGNPTFRELMRRSRDVTLSALEHKDVPFDRVVQAVRPHLADPRSPLFQAMLVLHDTRLPDLTIAGLDISPVDVESGTTTSDLVLLVATGPRLVATLEYDADRIGGTSAARLLRHLRRLMEGAVADPDRRLSDLPLMDDDERHRVLVAFNDTAADVGPARCLHESVATQAEATPRAEALCCGAQRLTYAELEAESNRLAHHLRSQGVTRGSIVGLHLPRSIHAVVAMIAVMKAGGAYLPLDPDDPPERLRRQIQAAGVDLVLTDRPVGDVRGLGAVFDAATTVVDVTDARIDAQPAAPLDADGDPGDLAYVLMTSGSTGRPKGVMVEHRSVHNHLAWRQCTTPLSPADVVVLSTRLTFDPSVWEVFGPLSAGARLVIPEPDTDLASLPDLIARQGVTVLQAVPSVLEALLDSPDIARCTTLTHVVCGGEPLPAALLARWSARVPGELHHVYGPTEATIEATHWRCTTPHDQASRVPIGRPIANTTVHLLDHTGAPVPIGVPGEIHIGGVGVARGYVDDPVATAERFVPDPFDEDPRARLFRTGDLARWREDGDLDFLGRVDRQLKVRGVRVDPGEIEAVLVAHPEVQQAAVVPSDLGSGPARLTAFVTPAGVSPSDVGRHAAQRLPQVMVPDVIVPLKALPHTARGKVDLQRLTWQADHHHVRPAADGLVGARDGIELAVQQVFESLLPVGRVGVTDDFFDLGGHSLMAMRAVARIADALGVDVAVADLVRERTVEGLARLLRSGGGPTSPIVSLQPHGHGCPLVLIHPLHGSAVSYVQLARALGDRRPVDAIDARGLRDGEAPDASITDMARTALAAVRGSRGDGPHLLAGWSMGGVIAFEMARLLEREGEHPAGVILLDARPVPPDDATIAEALRRLGEGLGLTAEDLVQCIGPDWQAEQELRGLAELARRAGVAPRDVRIAGLRRQLDVVRANLRAMQHYDPQPYGGRLTLLEAAESAATGHRAAWDDLAAGGIDRHVVPGDHHTMLREPHVHEVARVLAAVCRPMESVATA